MRPVFVLCALAGLAFAAPSVRWLDETGGFQSAAVKRLVEETPTSLKVELAPAKGAADSKPRILSVPMLRVLEFVREDDQDEEQRRLLSARTAVVAGVDMKAACETLDRLAEKAREPWVREYAAAFRAIGARYRVESDALERITGFLRKYPESRFVPAALRARAWVESLPVTDMLELSKPFGQAFEEIGKRNGPLVDQYGCMEDAVSRNTVVNAVEMRGLLRSLRGTIKEKRPNASAAEFAIRMSTEARSKVLVIGLKWREAVAADIPTEVFREDLSQLENSADLLLPDALVMLRMEQAALAVHDQRLDAAARYYRLASAQPAGQVRKLQLKRALDHFSELRKKR